jgi:hypothetical protein
MPPPSSRLKQMQWRCSMLYRYIARKVGTQIHGKGRGGGACTGLHNLTASAMNLLQPWIWRQHESSKTLVSSYNITWYHNIEDHNPNIKNYFSIWYTSFVFLSNTPLYQSTHISTCITECIGHTMSLHVSAHRAIIRRYITNLTLLNYASYMDIITFICTD